MSDKPTEPVIEVGKASTDAADLHRLRAENAKMAAALASLRAGRNPHTLLVLEWGERIHGYQCGARTSGIYHDVVMMNEDSRAVRCRYCGETLDAFDVLLDFARGERQFNFAVDAARREVTRLRSDIEELTKTRKNSMAAVARARKTIQAGEAIAAAAILAAARVEAEAAEAAAVARAAEEERRQSAPPPLEPYASKDEIPP